MAWGQSPSTGLDCALMTKWNYCMVAVMSKSGHRLPDADIERLLEKYGREGWELVSTAHYNGFVGTLNFKRLILA